MCADVAEQIYWSGGMFRVGLVHRPDAFTEDALKKAVAVLEEFRAECQRMYFAFNGTLNGRRAARRKYEGILTNRDALISAGGGRPDGEQIPRQSTMAELTQGELVALLVEGGDFEDRQNKAFLVMVYGRWEEWYRDRIAKALDLKEDHVRSTLMGEVRELRNLILHKNAMIPTGFSCPFLSQIWGDIETGCLVVTDQMIYALMEQLNAIRVEAIDHTPG